MIWVLIASLGFNVLFFAALVNGARLIKMQDELLELSAIQLLESAALLIKAASRREVPGDEWKHN